MEDALEDFKKNNQITIENIDKLQDEIKTLIKNLIDESLSAYEKIKIISMIRNVEMELDNKMIDLINNKLRYEYIKSKH